MFGNHDGNFNPLSLLMWDMFLADGPCTRVLDGDANYGEMLANVELPNVTEVIAVEPNSLLRPYLRRTLEEDGLEARYVCVAASDTKGTARFLRDDDWSGTSRVLEVDEEAGNWLEVPQITADSIVAETRGTLRLARKVDVEGNETAVLRGAYQSLARAADYSILCRDKAHSRNRPSVDLRQF